MPAMVHASRGERHKINPPIFRYNPEIEAPSDTLLARSRLLIIAGAR
jgi:hypothetical protein